MYDASPTALRIMLYRVMNRDEGCTPEGLQEALGLSRSTCYKALREIAALPFEAALTSVLCQTVSNSLVLSTQKETRTPESKMSESQGAALQSTSDSVAEGALNSNKLTAQAGHITVNITFPDNLILVHKESVKIPEIVEHKKSSPEALKRQRELMQLLVKKGISEAGDYE